MLSRGSSRSQMLDGAILVVMVVVVYGRLVGYDFQSHWDDNVYILNNENVRGFSWEHIRAAFAFSSIGQYNPLSLLSFMLDYTLWGLHPGGYHLTNIVIHAANGLLVYRLMLRLHDERLMALITSALFLLHPVQVESVAWIAERKGLLSLLFFLLSWHAYIRYREAGEEKGGLAYAASLAAYVLSLLAKTMTVVAPVILVLYDLCFRERKRRLHLKDKIPFVIAAAAFSAIEMYSEQPQRGGSLTGYHGGSPLATFFTMLTVFCRYLRLLIWPAGLNVEHMPPLHRSVDVAVVGAFLLLAALFFAGTCLYRSDRKLGFWGMFFWLGLLPVSQIVPLFLLMYEHYLYMPIIGAAALVGSGAVFLRGKVGTPRWAPFQVLIIIWLMALSVVSSQRTAVWRDSLSLFTDAAAKSPNSFRVWEVLGGVYRSAGNEEAARKSYERSLEIKSDNTDVLWALGDMYTEAGELDKGYAYLKRLLEINPTYVKGWATLGNNYLDRGDYAAAENAYKRAQELQPEAVQVVVLLGDLALVRGRFDEARKYIGQAEAKGWNPAETAYLMAGVEARAGRISEALTWLEKSLQRGYRDYGKLSTDKELSALWDDPRFNYLLMQYFPQLERLP